MAELHDYDVIIRPVITEKTNRMAEELNQYVFEVAPTANKVQIKDAVAFIFGLEDEKDDNGKIEKRVIEKVRTMVMPAKRGRRGRNWYIRSRQWKKAIVTLAPGETIDLFNV